MKEIFKQIKCEEKDLKYFGITFGTILLIISAYCFWSKLDYFIIYLIAAGFIYIISFTLKNVIKPLYLIWMAFSMVLGWVMTRIIIISLFYLVVTPIALIAKLFKKKFLVLSSDNNLQTFWNYRKKESIRKVNYERQF